MKTEDMVQANEVCRHHNITLSFIQTLHEFGLIEIVIVNEEIFLPISGLARLEKIIRLHFDLNINIEGIEAITHLLRRVEEMQSEITRLNNLLKVYHA